ncbi:MAG TPA: hypothetical protein VNZ44_17510, partial [Pyrinomonadaceae bacterium]|nr:hypothetical protein [Pyrinomonadaceae bacterium]
QSTRSNYCGVYSTGMLLSLLGLATSRRQALALFNLGRSNPHYPGSTHPEMACAFAGAAGATRWRWQFYVRFDFAAVARSLRAHFRATGRPTLLSFGAVHRNGVWRCTHVAVAVAAGTELIALLDPLGFEPPAGGANVWLRRTGGAVRVAGSSYSLHLKSEAAVLRWAAGETR